MKFHFQGCQRGLNDHSGEEFSFFPLFFFIFSRLRVSIDLLIDLKWPGAERANFGCIILSPFRYSPTQRETPPTAQNKALPKAGLGKTLQARRFKSESEMLPEPVEGENLNWYQLMHSYRQRL